MHIMKANKPVMITKNTKGLHLRNILVLAMLTLIAGCANTQESMDTPSSPTYEAAPSSAKTDVSNGLKLFLSGNTLVLTGRFRRTNAPWKSWLYYAPDGSLFGKVDSGISDAGRWWIDNKGLVCRKWKKWDKQNIACFHLDRHGTAVKTRRAKGYGTAPSRNVKGFLMTGNVLEQ